MERREEKNENTRSARVINPRLLTGASHFSTPRLATCGAPQWNPTHCVPERTPPPTANYSEHRVCVCVCVCLCVCVRAREKGRDDRHESAFAFAASIFCFPKYRPIHLPCHTLTDTVTSVLYARAQLEEERKTRGYIHFFFF